MSESIVEGGSVSKTPLRRFIIWLAPSKPTRWITPRQAWRVYSFLDWLALRTQDLAINLEDAQDEKP